MLVKTYLSMLIFLLSHGNILAQGENNWWCISQEMAIDFNQQPPNVSTSALTGNPECVSSISDEFGRLLLYSDGNDLFDGNHQIVSNGSGLDGHHNASQGVVFTKAIGQEDLLYIFTLSSVDFHEPLINNGVMNPLKYSTIRLGDNLDPTRIIDKNQLLGRGYTELMTVAKGSCGTLWLITHLHSNDEFHAYHLTASGIDPVPVISNVGRSFLSDDMWRGRIIMNKTHDKLLVSGGSSVELFEFDVETGIISNAVLVDNLEKFSTACFSPDGQKAYVYTGNHTIPVEIRQYDLNATDIPLSKYLIAQDYYGGQFVISDLHLGPDDRIYVGMFLNSFIGVIENPNALGSDVIFDPEGVDLDGGTFRKFAMQNDFVVPDPLPEEYEIFAWTDTILCDAEVIDLDLTAQSLENIRWQDATISPTYTIDSPGMYYVEAYLNNCLVSDTVLVNYSNDAPTDLISPVISDGCTQSYTSTYDIIQWSTGSTDDTIYVSNSGTYSLEVAIGACMFIDSFTINIPESFTYSIDTTLCPGELFVIGNNSIDAAGIYRDTFVNNQGCDSIIEVSITIEQFKDIITPIGADGCIQAFTSDYQVIQWSTGITDDTITISNSGTYWVDVNTDNCIVTDSFVVDIAESNFSASDTSLCFGESLFWKNQSILTSGIYNDTLTNNSGCDSIIQLSVTILDQLIDTIDITICEGDSVEFIGESILTAGIYQEELMTQNDCDSIVILILEVVPTLIGDTTYAQFDPAVPYVFANLEFDMPGFYPVVLSGNQGCDSIVYLELSQDDDSIPVSDSFDIPNIFSPNGDGLNDEFSISLPINSDAIIEDVSIMDRWGNLLVSASPNTSSFNWNGANLNGDSVNNGVYVYGIRLAYTDGSRKFVTGDVTVIR